MTHVFRCICISVLLVSGFSACVTVKDEIFLRNIEIEGSPSQPPVHVTPAEPIKGSIQISPQLSVGTGTVSSTLDKQFEGQTPDSLVDFRRKGLYWNLPRLTFGLDIDATVSENFALHAGMASSVRNNRQLMSFYGGMGLLSADPNTSVRMDIGVQYVDIQYRGATVVLRTVNSEPADTLYFLDRGKEFQFNLFANVTLNSTHQDRSLNWFVQLGINPQTLTTFTPSDRASDEGPGSYIVSDHRAESSVFWLSATPGVYVNLSENRRVLIGVRLLKELLNESSQPGLVAIPMIQFDWRL